MIRYLMMMLALFGLLVLLIGLSACTAPASQFETNLARQLGGKAIGRSGIGQVGAIRQSRGQYLDQL